MNNSYLTLRRLPDTKEAEVALVQLYKMFHTNLEGGGSLVHVYNIIMQGG